MPINVFGNSTNNSDTKNVTSLFVQKHYLRTSYMDANFVEDIDIKNQYRIKNLSDTISIREAAPKNYVEHLFNYPSIQKNTKHIDLNDRNITNKRFIQVNQLPQIDSHLAAKLFVDNSIDEPSLVRINQDNDFNNINLTNINGITLNKQAEIDIEVIIKAYVDQFHQENERSRRDSGLDFHDEPSDIVKNIQDKDLNDKKLTNSDSINVSSNPSLDNELANKKYVDDELNKNTILRFNQTLENYPKVSIGKDTCNLTKYDKIQITDITEIVYPNVGGYLQQNWIITANDINNNSKIQNFIRSTKTTSPTGASGATRLTPIGTSFMYTETSSGNHGHDRIFFSWKRTNIIQITNITFYYNRFSNLTNDSLKSMGRFRDQL